MAEEQKTTPANPATNTPGVLTLADVQKMIGEATAPLLKQLETALADQKVLSDTLAKLPPAAMDEAKIVDAALAKLAAKTAADGEVAAKKAAVDKYTAEKMADIAKTFPELIKLGEDPAKWADEEQAIRSVAKERLAAAGVKTADVGGDAGGKAIGAGTPAASTGNLTAGEAAYAASIKLP